MFVCAEKERRRRQSVCNDPSFPDDSDDGGDDGDNDDHDGDVYPCMCFYFNRTKMLTPEQNIQGHVAG